MFYNLTRNMRTPPNYVLYNVGDSLSTKPELSWNHELGWRFQQEDMLLSATLFLHALQAIAKSPPPTRPATTR